MRYKLLHSTVHCIHVISSASLTLFINLSEDEYKKVASYRSTADSIVSRKNCSGALLAMLF